MALHVEPGQEDAGRDPDQQPAGVHRAERQRWGGFRPGADYLR
jgi:hypothetical protein